MSLNKDQAKALKGIQTWWKGNEMYAVLDGAGGVGKSYLAQEILKHLPKSSPILLAPTHEALKQLRDKVGRGYNYRTVHSALGLTPTTTEKELKFEHRKLPSLWENVNLAIIDESSMLDTWVIELLKQTKTRILYIGHKSQLPPVLKNRGIFDPCLSPVFDLGYKTFTLKEPIRNSGTLWDFTCQLEELIYTKEKKIPETFDVDGERVKELIHSEKGKEQLLQGNLKIVLWTNSGVDKYNERVRSVLFGHKSKAEKYLPGDKILLTAPLTLVPGLEFTNDTGLKRLNQKDLDYLYSNTKATVKSCKKVIISLNYSLHIECYKLTVDVEGSEESFYEVVNAEDLKNMEVYYEHIAWGFKSSEAKAKAYKERWFILSCFAKIKHFYAATSHRLQGSTIENVIVVNNDINKNLNQIEQKKCRYVACSRASKELFLYRGI